MLDNNVNKNQQIPYQAITPGQLNQQGVPMEAGIQANPELLKEEIQDSYVGNRVAETTSDLKGMAYTGLIAIPTWYGIAKGMDYYAKKSRGDYETTVHYKIGKFFDDLTDKYKNSSLGKSSFNQSVNDGFKSFKKFCREKIIDKSRILRAFFDTPSVPELDMVKGQAKGMIGFLGYDYPQVLENFFKTSGSAQDLERYGASASDIKKYAEEIGKATTADARALAIQKAEFEVIMSNAKNGALSGQTLIDKTNDFLRLSADERGKKLNEMKAVEGGFKSHTRAMYVKEHTSECLSEILEASHNANRKMYSSAYQYKTTFWGKLRRTLFNREVHFSEFANKIAASLGSDASKPEWQQVLERTGLGSKVPKSLLGKFFAKYNNLVLEGATNRVAGGKLVAIAQALYFADVIYKSMTAEGGMSEKSKAFAERFTEMLAFFICMPMSIQLMHRIGGLQYAGMTKEQVAKYRENLKIHNEKAMGAKFSDKAAWKASKQNLRNELKAGVKNPFTLLAKKIGRIVTVGLEQIRPYQKEASTRKGVMEKIKDMFRSPGRFKFGLKQMAGYPMRIGLGLLVILPFFNKIAVKTCHAIVGKPKHSVLDEGKEEEQKQNVQQPQAQNQIPPQLQDGYNPQQQNNNPFQQQQTTQQTITQNQNTTLGQSPTNLLNKYRNGNYQTATTTTTTTTNTVNNKNNEPVRTYIPSPVGVILNSAEDVTSADEAMRRADLAEQQALETLKMK